MGAGLVITEFTSVTNDAITFWREPCIADDDQVAKWKEIVDAVHAAGGKIFCQIAHGGRAAHPMCNDGRAGVAPSPIALTHRCGKDFNPTGEEQPYVEPPTELTDEAAGELVQAFREAARKAVKVAGFDGVEVHGANGFDLAYLHVMRGDFFGIQKADVVTPAREVFKNTLVVNMGYDAKEAQEGIAAGSFDVVAFGTTFLANPDLPARIKKGAELNTPKPDLFYKGEAKGYTDYPFLESDNEEKKEA